MCICLRLLCACAQHQRLAPGCEAVLQERAQQASLHLGFTPDLADACEGEVAAYCGSPHLKGAAVMDCLADARWALQKQIQNRMICG